MGGSYKEYTDLVEDLKSSYTEEDIIEKITKIVKRFHSDLWKEMIYKNPYYKSLFVDIKEDILEDLQKIKKNIIKEIDSIDKEIRSGEVDVHKFIQLKVECQLLLMEVDLKLEELDSI